MTKIGILQGVISENKNFPYTTWKSEFEKINDAKVDFLDWIVDSNPISTFHNFLFSNEFKFKINEGNLKKEIRSVYCSCFDEYNLLLPSSSEKLYKRISILEKIMVAAIQNDILQIVIPIFSKEKEVTQKQIDNIVFILRMSLRNCFHEKQKILIETDLDIDSIIEIFHKIDNDQVGLSLKAKTLSTLSFMELTKIKKYLFNVTVGNDFENFIDAFKNLDDLQYNGHYLIDDKLFLDKHLNTLFRWCGEENK